MTESEARTFWDTHEITEEYLAAAGLVAPGELPPTRPDSIPVALHISRDTLRRIKALARKRGKGSQDLLKEFVIERLDEEEKRQAALERASRE